MKTGIPRPLAHHPHLMARGLASLGRGGDNTLVHMSHKEVAGLQNLARAHGKSLTVNPSTGLPEAFGLKDIVPELGGLAASYFFPDSPVSSALTYTLGDYLSNKNLATSISNGLAFYGTEGLGKGLMDAYNAPSASTPAEPSTGTTGTMGTATNQAEALAADSTYAPSAAETNPSGVSFGAAATPAASVDTTGQIPDYSVSDPQFGLHHIPQTPEDYTPSYLDRLKGLKNTVSDKLQPFENAVGKMDTVYKGLNKGQQYGLSMAGAQLLKAMDEQGAKPVNPAAANTPRYYVPSTNQPLYSRRVNPDFLRGVPGASPYIVSIGPGEYTTDASRVSKYKAGGGITALAGGGVPDTQPEQNNPVPMPQNTQKGSVPTIQSWLDAGESFNRPLAYNGATYYMPNIAGASWQAVNKSGLSGISELTPLSDTEMATLNSPLLQTGLYPEGKDALKRAEQIYALDPTSQMGMSSLLMMRNALDRYNLYQNAPTVESNDNYGYYDTDTGQNNVWGDNPWSSGLDVASGGAWNMATPVAGMGHSAYVATPQEPSNPEPALTQADPSSTASLDTTGQIPDYSVSDPSSAASLDTTGQIPDYSVSDPQFGLNHTPQTPEDYTSSSPQTGNSFDWHHPLSYLGNAWDRTAVGHGIDDFGRAISKGINTIPQGIRDTAAALSPFVLGPAALPLIGLNALTRYNGPNYGVYNTSTMKHIQNAVTSPANPLSLYTNPAWDFAKAIHDHEYLRPQTEAMMAGNTPESWDLASMPEYSQPTSPPIHGQHAAGGEIHNYAAGGGIGSLPHTYAAGGKLLRGPGDGMSDSIPAVIGGHQPQRAALADGEFVIPADVVSHLGNGSTEAGSRKLYHMMAKVRHARTGRAKQAPKVNADKFLAR